MLPYIICFFLVIFFTYIAEINFKKNKKVVGIIFSIFVIIVPSIMAGIRSLEIGSDTRGYALTDFLKAGLYKDFKALLNNTNEEMGFVLLAYIVRSFTNNIHYFLFLIELIIMIFIYLYAYYKRDKINMTFFMCIYMLMCYPESFCIMRQHMSLAIFLYSIKFLEEKKYKKMLLLYFIAMQFHISAIVASIIYVLYIIEKLPIDNKRKNKIYVIIISAIALIFILYPKVLDLLINNLKILPTRYNIYFSKKNDYYNKIVSFSSGRILFKFFWLMIPLVSLLVKKNNIKEEVNFSKIAIILFVLDIFIYVLSLKFIILSRVSYFLFYPAAFFTLKDIHKIFKKDIFNQIICYLIIISISLVYFYVINIKNANEEGSYKTYPYKTYIVDKNLLDY